MDELAKAICLGRLRISVAGNAIEPGDVDNRIAGAVRDLLMSDEAVERVAKGLESVGGYMGNVKSNALARNAIAALLGDR